ncbi:MAG: YbaN family protein [Gammaproteobacteria bacterium]
MIPAAQPLLWRVLAILMLLLGLVGLVLPVMPTVPFLVGAAWAGGRGWPALEARLLAHPVFGASIRQWRERGAVPRRAKWAASIMMLGSATMIVLAPVPVWLKVMVPLAMAAVVLWLWRRPDA